MAARVRAPVLWRQCRKQTMRTGKVTRHATEDGGNSATAKQIMSPRGRTNDVRLQHAQEVWEASLDTPPPYDKLELAITKAW